MCRTKTIEQHELFEHIIGFWRSAIIGGEILTRGLDACQAGRILIILSWDIVIPIWDELPSATDAPAFHPSNLSGRRRSTDKFSSKLIR